MQEEKDSLSLKEQLKDILLYEPEKGEFFLLKQGNIHRKLFPNEEGYLVFFKNSVRYKLRASKVAVELGWGTTLHKDKVILHLNLNERDYRLVNLRIITRKVRMLIREAQRNLEGGLRIETNPSRPYTYLIVWKEDKKERATLVQDIIVAKKLLTKMKLKYSKILSKYCVFD
jgi:hypothetical protein